MATYNKRDLARLQAVLDAHGANPARWPAAEAAGLMAFAKFDSEGIRMLASARALDRVLAAAPGAPGGGVDALADRILAKAAVTKPAAAPAEIVALPVRQRGGMSPAAGHPLRLWKVVGAMAAALVIGLYVGGSDFVAPAFQQVAGLSQDEIETAAPAVQQAVDEPQEGELL